MARKVIVSFIGNDWCFSYYNWRKPLPSPHRFTPVMGIEIQTRQPKAMKQQLNKYFFGFSGLHIFVNSKVLLRSYKMTF